MLCDEREVDAAIVTINWFIWAFDAKQKSSEWFQVMSVSRATPKVNLCKWAEPGGRLFRSECQAKQPYTSFLFTGREASHLIMHSSFWCFDEVLKFGQKEHVQFITPNCSGCVLVSAICQMYEGPDLKKPRVLMMQIRSFLSICGNGRGAEGVNIKTFCTECDKRRWQRKSDGGVVEVSLEGEAKAHKMNSRQTHK